MNWGALERQLARLRHGDHVCSFYEDAADQIPVLVSWAREGLAQGQRCVYVTDSRTADEAARALAIFGVDVDMELRHGSLQFLGKWDWRHEGTFDQDLMASHVKAIVARSLAAEFKGVWVAVEMTWTRDPDVSAEAVATWEGMWNDLLMDMPVVLLCMYDRREFAPEFLRPELHTHAFVIHDRKVYPNCYFDKAVSEPDSKLDLNAMLERVVQEPAGTSGNPPSEDPRTEAA
jgi:hypothetical protein